MDKDFLQNKDKRKFDRKQLYYYLKVYNDPTNELLGYLGNISSEGLMLFSEKSIDVDLSPEVIQKDFGKLAVNLKTAH